MTRSVERDSDADRSIERESTDDLVERLELLCRRSPEAASQEAGQVLEQERDTTRRARLLGCLAAACRSQGRPGGLSLLTEALALTSDPRALAELHSRRALAFLDQARLTSASLACRASLQHALDADLDTVGRAFVVEGVVAFHRDMPRRSRTALELAVPSLCSEVPGGLRFKHSAHVARGIARIELGDVAGAERDLLASRGPWASPHDESPRLAARVASVPNTR